MFSVFIIVLLLIAAVVLLLFKIPGKPEREVIDSYRNRRTRPATPDRRFRIYALIPLVLALIVLGFATTAVVQARQSGVLLTFGKPAERTLDPGLNVKLPWQKVVTVNTLRQTDNYNDGKNDETDHSVIKVRLGNGNVSEAYASVTWQVDARQANTVYSEFRGDDPTEAVYERLIAPNFKLAVQNIGGEYNPTEAIASVLAKQQDGQAVINASEIKLAPDYDALSKSVLDAFTKRLDPEDGEPLVKVIAVQVSFIDFDAKTQSTINEFQDEVQKTIVALQGVQTASNIAKQNEKLAASVSKDPEVLPAQCFKLIADGKLTPPAGFSCYPGGSAGVVVGAK